MVFVSLLESIHAWAPVSVDSKSDRVGEMAAKAHDNRWVRSNLQSATDAVCP